ncbi:hypothetical protein NPIL_285131, partial [Nephila pilipes]
RPTSVAFSLAFPSWSAPLLANFIHCCWGNDVHPNVDVQSEGKGEEHSVSIVGMGENSHPIHIKYCQ